MVFVWDVWQKPHLQFSLCHLQCQVCDTSRSNTGSCWRVNFIPDCVDINLSVKKNSDEVGDVHRCWIKTKIKPLVLKKSKLSAFCLITELRLKTGPTNLTTRFTEIKSDSVSHNLTWHPQSAGLPLFHSVELLPANADWTIDTPVYDEWLSSNSLKFKIR